MKIGILTLPLVDNYGGILQAVALYKYLKNNGYEVVLINKVLHISLWKKIAKYFLSLVFPEKYNTVNQSKRKEIHKSFINNEIKNISEILISTKNLRSYAIKEKFDTIIVGSDQVWRKSYINDKYYKNFFLDFIDDKTKKISYAASFGKNHWEGINDINEISKLLEKFNAVSTRESSGVDICKNTFGYNNVKHVLDPTLLMDKNFYINEIISKYDIHNIQKGGLVTYVLDEAVEKKEIIDSLKHNLNIKNVYHIKGFNSLNFTYSIPKWLASIAYADFIVTDSFHGMVFSIIFEKEFLVIGNQGRGLDRFTSLLSILGLENRLIYDKKNLGNTEINSIDYNSVNKILDNQRLKSFDFLKNSLSEL